MNLTKTEIATLKWLLKQGQEMQAMSLAGPDVRLGHAGEIIKHITMRPCNAKHARRAQKS